VLIFFIAGLLISLRLERVDNLGAYRIPPETGILIPSGFVSHHAPAFCVMQKKSRPDIRRGSVLLAIGKRYAAAYASTLAAAGSSK
jgi:hypothetical protein